MSEAAPTVREEERVPADLKKRLTAYLAQKLTLSLFMEGKEAELREAISRLVVARLVEENVMLKEGEERLLIDELIAGLPRHNILKAAEDKGEKAKRTWDVDSLRAHVAPYIADHTGNHLFQPGREAQLAEAVYMLVREKIAVDGLEVGEGLQRELIEKICSNMAIPLPSALNPHLAPPVKSATPPPPPPPPAEPGAEGPKADTRKLDVAGVDWEELTEESRRLILLHMGSRLKPEVLASGNPDAAQIHVAELLGGAVKEYRVRLTEAQREEIMATILSGEGLEFQL